MNCHKDIHWAKVCRSNPQGITSTRGRQRNRANSRPCNLTNSRDRRRRRAVSRNRRDGNERELSDQFKTIIFESITVNAIAPRKLSEDEVFVTVAINLRRLSNRPATLRAKLNAGAQGKVLPLRLYHRIYPEYSTPGGLSKPEVVKQLPTVLTAYDGAKIKQHGKCAITCEFNGRRSEAILFITEAEEPAIIGLATSLELNLVILNCSLQKRRHKTLTMPTRKTYH